MNVLPFILATASLLAIPGPTNTLLATSGAGVGAARSLPLLAAELGGYLLSIMLLRSVLGPFMQAVPVAGIVLRIVVSAYLIYLACMLWRHGARELAGRVPVSFRRVLITTFLNPKAVIFAFTLLPLQVAAIDLLLWLILLAVQIVTIGSGWIALGAALGRGLQGVGRPLLIYRLSAVALVMLAGMIGAQSLTMA
ncbi:LysE family transporter [Bradyrhizobium manausense]|uniref:LysE family translocator n=1 Tax=Bradyrhizobium TaxID=374 RepID=UPI001BABBCF1|nr:MULTISPECIES: LysE family transporter [Bradyrhizobium]MBR0825720.1 LysE family transporter [Bradyrhizobium manausense]UVO31333.1 LysE family transporter [Bradyrhizobium arachidis]